MIRYPQVPPREDIQIIVVDDNSDNDKKPQVDRAEVEVVLLNASQSKGAGRARNVGLKHAKGKWVLFIDCDDTYKENLVPFLEKYKDSEVSVLYNQLYRTYILTNAFWLLVIRMAYTNRIAYLSWMLIPYIVLYPIVYNRDNLRNPQNNIFRIMALRLW